MWAMHYFRPTFSRSFVTSGGAMGFGIPAAIGAQAVL